MTTMTATAPSATPIGQTWDVVIDGDGSWRAGALAMLSVRFIQGFIYWGGGSRRFIYAPSKLDPHMPVWMANKFQTAMPGALLGMDHVIAFMLKNFLILYPSVILFSGAELVAGLFLMLGLFTRASALVSVGFSIVLMLMFGWQGATCIDEWTMAACNLAMGASLVLAGSGAFSVDNALLHRRPAMAHRRWFRWAAGALPLPLEARRFNALALAVLAAVAVFNVATYDHFRGSVYSAYHKGPVSPSADHYTLSEATVATDGSVHFHIYLDGGTADVPSHIAEVQLRGKDGAVLERWDMTALSTLSATAIQNDFAYNKFKIARFGLSAEMGSMATIDLPPRATLASSAQTLVAIDIDGRSFSTAISQVDAAPKT